MKDIFAFYFWFSYIFMLLLDDGKKWCKLDYFLFALSPILLPVVLIIYITNKMKYDNDKCDKYGDDN